MAVFKKKYKFQFIGNQGEGVTYDLKIYLADSINTIKEKLGKKFKEEIMPQDLYFYVRQPATFSPQLLYNEVNERAVFTGDDASAILTKIAKNSGFNNVSDFDSLVAVEHAQFQLIPLGQTFEHNAYCVNPFDSTTAPTASSVVSENTRKVLLDYGEILNDTIYFCWRKGVEKFFNKRKNVNMLTILNIYFPDSMTEVPVTVNLNPRLLRNAYDDYSENNRVRDLKFYVTTLEFSLQIAPLNIRLPLDVLFKSFLHATPELPVIKYGKSFRVGKDINFEKYEKILKRYAHSTDREIVTFCFQSAELNLATGLVICDLYIDGHVKVLCTPPAQTVNATTTSLNTYTAILFEVLQTNLFARLQTYLTENWYDVYPITELNLTHRNILNIDIKASGSLANSLKISPDANYFFELTKDKEDKLVLNFLEGKGVFTFMKAMQGPVTEFSLSNIQNPLYLDVFPVYLQTLCTEDFEKEVEEEEEKEEEEKEEEEKEVEKEEVEKEEVEEEVEKEVVQKEVVQKEVVQKEVEKPNKYLGLQTKTDFSLESSDVSDDENEDENENEKKDGGAREGPGGQPANYFIKRLIDYSYDNSNPAEQPWGTKTYDQVKQKFVYKQQNFEGPKFHIYKYPIPITPAEKMKLDENDRTLNVKSYYKPLSWQNNLYICPRFWSVHDNMTVDESQIGPGLKYEKSISAVKDSDKISIEDERKKKVVFAFGNSVERKRGSFFKPEIKDSYNTPRCVVLKPKEKEAIDSEGVGKGTVKGDKGDEGDEAEGHEGEGDEGDEGEGDEGSVKDEDEGSVKDEGEDAEEANITEPTNPVILDFVEKFPSDNTDRFVSLPSTISSFYSFRALKRRDLIKDKPHYSLVRSVRKGANSFVECLAYLLDKSLTEIKNDLLKISKKEYRTLLNGNLAKQQKHEAFIQYLNETDVRLINYAYVWDYLRLPGNKIVDTGLNVIIMEMVGTSTDTEFAFICPKNPYATRHYYNETNPYIILLRSVKDPLKFEPVVFVRAEGKSIRIEKMFLLASASASAEHFTNKLQEVTAELNQKCAPKSHPNMEIKRSLAVEDVINKIKEYGDNDAIYQLVGYDGKVIGVGLQNKGKDGNFKKMQIIPCYPSGILPEYETEKMWKVTPRSYYDVLRVLQSAFIELQIPCKPVANVLDDNDEEKVIGILTESNDFLPVKPYLSLEEANDARMKYNAGAGAPQIAPLRNEYGANYHAADATIFAPSVRDASPEESMVSNITLETVNYYLFRRAVSYYLTRLKNNKTLSSVRKYLLPGAQAHGDRALGYQAHGTRIPHVIDMLRIVTASHIEFGATTDSTRNGQLIFQDTNLVDKKIKNRIFYYAKVADELLRNRRTRDLILTNQITLGFEKVVDNYSVLPGENLYENDKENENNNKENNYENNYDNTQPLNITKKDYLTTYGS